MSTASDVTILLSVYHPEYPYLKKQLRSLEQQTYEKKQMLIWIDDPADIETSPWVESLKLSIPYEIYKAEKNLGYIKAFEQLTRMAETPYIAYCDQDDLWDPEKLEKCIHILEKEDAVLVTTDRRVIDENDQVLVESDCQESPNVQNSWKTGDDITLRAATSCMAIGMSIVMRTDAAQKAMPFSVHTGHDKWLTLCASHQGKVAFIKEPLVSYRRHGKNVSGVLSGITCKKDYFDDRIHSSYEVAKQFCEKYPDDHACKEILRYAGARQEGKILTLWKMRDIAPEISRFEIVYHMVPDFVFRLGIKLIRHFAQ